MRLKLKNNISITLLIFIICTLVALATLGNYRYYKIQLNNKMKSIVESDLSSHNEAIAQSFNTRIDSIFLSLQQVAVPFTTSNMSSSVFVQSLQQHNNKGNLGNLSYFSLDYISNYAQDPSIFSMSEDKNTIYYGSHFSGSDLFIDISIPIKKDNKMIGALRSSYSPKIAMDFLFDSRNKESTMILKSDGTAIIDPSSTSTNHYFDYLKSAKFYNNSNLESLQQDFLNKEKGTLHYQMNNEEVYAHYTPIDGTDLFLYTIIPASDIEHNSNIFFLLTKSLCQNLTIILSLFIFFILCIQIFYSVNLEKNQSKLLLEKDRYQTVLAHSQAALWEYNIATNTMSQSDPDLGIYTGFSEVKDYETSMLVDKIVHPKDIGAFHKFCNALRTGQNEIVAEFRATDISGSYVWFELSGTTLFDNNGTPISVIGQSTNIDMKKQELEVLRNHANRDSLTKLNNRAALVSKIDDCLNSSDEAAQHAFFMIDIDNFKSVNDTYGHSFGDAVLMDLGTHLARNFKEPYIIGRLGGDEFVVFIKDAPTMSFIEEQAQTISHIFRKVYSGTEEEDSISGSIGISLYPSHGKTFDSLMEKADIALYHSKNLGKDCYSFYQTDMKDSVILPDSDIAHKESCSLHMDRSLIDSSIFSNIVDLMFDSKNKESSIAMILSLIGNYYNIDCLNIVEYSDDESTASITFEWASEDTYRIAKHFQNVPINEADTYAIYKTTPYSVYYSNDFQGNSYAQTDYATFFSKLTVSGVFQCGLSDGIHSVGFINALLCDGKQAWSKSDIDSLTLLCKIIGSYLTNTRIQEKSDHNAMHDSLTGAYNVSQFALEVPTIISQNPDQQYAVIYFDINRFKLFNDNYGYSEGDRILIEFSKILERAAQPNEIFARVNADKFLGLFNYDNSSSFTKRLQALDIQFNKIKKTDTDYYKLSIAIGIYPIEEADNISTQIDKANIARKYIKEYHKTTFSFFNESMKSALKKQKEIEDIMEDSLLNGQFIVHYQPKINIATNKICGAEALVRWNRSGFGLVYPNDFIPIFEENGFIVDIDYYVFEQVCIHIRKLLDLEKNVVPISVNFSRIHFKNGILPSRLKSCVNHYDIPTSLIEIEITESAFVDDDGYLLTILNEMHNNGFKLSMDDFGSGLSSLNSLRKLPFDVLKLDKDFFQTSSATKRERVVIANIVKMANELNMGIVSEGIETREQADFLKEINCPVAQGYLFAKPMPAKEFENRYC